MPPDARSAAAARSAPHATRADGLPPSHRIAELDRVTIGANVVGDEGQTVPSGSTGTVVAIWGAGAAFEVEFEQPVSALATVRSELVASHHPRQPR